MSVVYQIIREHARANRLPAVNVSEILPKVLSRGRTKEDLERCMAEYEELDVWQVNADRTIIRFVDDGDNATGLGGGRTAREHGGQGLGRWRPGRAGHAAASPWARG